MPHQPISEADRRYLDLVQVAVVLLDRDGRVELINRVGCEIVGWPAEEVIGRNWFDRFIPEHLRPQLRLTFRSLMAGELELVEHFENPVLTRSGEERLVAWHNTYIRDADGKIIGTLSSGEDVTETRSADERLRRTLKDLEELKGALDQASIVATTDAKGLITSVNDNFCAISQYSREELIGQDHRIVNSGLHPRSFFRDLWGTIRNGRIWRGEIRNRRKDGGFYWVDTTIVPFLGEDEKPRRFMAIRNDITSRKAAEEQLRRQESLAHIGRMAAQVAHEVKNPLAGISGALQIIGGRLQSGSEDQQIIAESLRRIDALNDWVQELLLFARPRTPRFRDVGALGLMRETATLLRRDPRMADVGVRVGGPDFVLSGDEEMLRQAFLNLLLNAAQAMDGQGTIRVTLETDGVQGRVVIRDRGPGIPSEVADRIFEPFVSTKTRGTGLGLAVVGQVVDAHAGEVSVDSPSDGGTRIAVILPLRRN